MRTSSRQWAFTTCTTGAFSTRPCSRSLANTGVSSTPVRMYRPTNTSAALSRKGTRQPQLRKASSLVANDITDNAPLASTMPAGAPSWAKLVVKPRRFGSVHSPAISTAPPHSPPTPMPWMMRKNVSSTAPQMPMLS